MKLVNYQLEKEMEQLSSDSANDMFLAYIRGIIEDTTKPYYQRADYIGLSILSLQEKIELLSKDISELQQLKKSLTLALDIAKEMTATVFINNGVDRIDGNIISSLTLTKESKKLKTNIEVLDKNALMGV